MKRLTALLVSLLFISTTAFAQLKAKDYEWMKSIRTDHPRMFFTAEDLPLMVNNSMLFDAPTYNGMQRRIDRIIRNGLNGKKNYGQREPQNVKSVKRCTRRRQKRMRLHPLNMSTDILSVRRFISAQASMKSSPLMMTV